MAAAFVNIRIRNGVMAPSRSGDDYEVGGDVILFDDISGSISSTPMAVFRNHEERNPHSNPPNQPSIMVKYPMRGGFVPFQAKLSDGSPHPHAGTGLEPTWRLLAVRETPSGLGWGHVRGERVLRLHGGVPVRLQ